MLRYALHAAAAPSAVMDEDFVELKKILMKNRSCEITAQVAFMGWWNRLNDSLVTTLDP